MTILRRRIAGIHRTGDDSQLSVATLDSCVLTIELSVGIDRHADASRALPTSLWRSTVGVCRVVVDDIGRYGSRIAIAVCASHAGIS